MDLSRVFFGSLASIRAHWQQKRKYRLSPMVGVSPRCFPERRHFSRNPKWGPSDFGCKKSGDGHGLRRPTFILCPSQHALRTAPGLPQGLDAVSHGLAFRLRRRSRAALRRNAPSFSYAPPRCPKKVALNFSVEIEALLRLVWVSGHSDLTQVVMGSPDWTTNGEVGSGVNLPATR